MSDEAKVFISFTDGDTKKYDGVVDMPQNDHYLCIFFNDGTKMYYSHRIVASFIMIEETSKDD